jgi:mRNA-degrading endonuclease toxin of MazEF toxin-antitoxin module
MTVNQRDIVEIAFYTGSKPEPHPAVVISNNDIFQAEGFFYAILLSTKNHFPEFTMEITPEMINSPRNSRTGYAVCHMIQQFYTEDVITRTGATLKADAFKRLTDQVKKVIFG